MHSADHGTVDSHTRQDPTVDRPPAMICLVLYFDGNRGKQKGGERNGKSKILKNAESLRCSCWMVQMNGSRRVIDTQYMIYVFLLLLLCFHSNCYPTTDTSDIIMQIYSIHYMQQYLYGTHTNT